MENKTNHSILSRDVFCVLGLPFDRVNLSESASIITSAIANKQQCFLTTPNVNFLIAAQSNVDFFQSVIESDLIVADGMPIIWVSKLLGIPLPERVAGSDLFDKLSHQQNQTEKMSVFFFGGEEGIAELAGQKLNESSEAMSCCGTYGPGFVSVDEMSTPDIIERINQANPDFLLIALGAGKGQAWIQKNREQLNAFAMGHLGAVINFVAGHVVRAPVFWQRTGLEWLWRIKQEPTLWKRYFFDGLAFIKLLTFNVLPLALYDRYLKRSADFTVPLSVKDESAEKRVVKLSGSIHHAVIEPVKHCFDEVLQGDKKNISLDCSALVHIDSAFIGTLLLFQGYLNEQGRELFLQNVSKRIVRIIKMNNVFQYFQINKVLP